MNRREVLRQVGILIGSAASVSAVARIHAYTPGDAAVVHVPQTLTGGRDEIVATLAEHIIPTTDTPGARATGVHVFLDRILTRVCTSTERARFLAGLADIEVRARTGGRSFLDSSRDTQVRILREMELEAASLRSRGTSETPFFQMLKELTLIGYYTSEIGATLELKYVHTAASYDSDVPFEKIGRAYSGP